MEVVSKLVNFIDVSGNKAIPSNRIMDALEQEQATLEATLADPELFSRDPAAFAQTTDRLVALEAEQTELLQRWEFVEQRLKELGDLAG